MRTLIFQERKKEKSKKHRRILYLLQNFAPFSLTHWNVPPFQVSTSEIWIVLAKISNEFWFMPQLIILACWHRAYKFLVTRTHFNLYLVLSKGMPDTNRHPNVAKRSRLHPCLINFFLKCHFKRNGGFLKQQ